MTYITFISYFILSYFINHIINIINDSYIRYTYSPVTYSYIQLHTNSRVTGGHGQQVVFVVAVI